MNSLYIINTELQLMTKLLLSLLSQQLLRHFFAKDVIFMIAKTIK